MKRAKLIKREEIIEREQTAASESAKESAQESPTQQPSVVRLTFDAVRKWANERQSNKSVKPREAFDALFAEPRTNE
jgi:predicted pyridoxine 5'-phosphate oxidase superfamily flavin-nucleotide-binding protein